MTARTALEDFDTMPHVEFDEVFWVDPNGQVHQGTRWADMPYVPTAEHHDEYDVLLDGIPHRDYPTWEALTGYTGQYSYNGAVMHSSEYLGGRLAADILATPGFYVLVVVEVLTDENDPIDPEPAGWAVLRLKEI